MTAGQDPREERPGCQGRAQRAPEGFALRPGRPRVQRPDACAATGDEGRDGRARLGRSRRRDLGSRRRPRAALHPRADPTDREGCLPNGSRAGLPQARPRP